MQIRQNRWIAAYILIAISITGCSKKQPPENDTPPQPPKTTNQSQSIIGHWQSIKLQGDDLANFITQITYTFETDGTFQAHAIMTDSTKDIKKGTYKIQQDNIIQKINGATLKREFHFENNNLIIFDPFLQTTIHLKKQ